jgi:hypothetical protein
MNLRCVYCQTPFTLGRLEKLAAIQKLQAEELHHYDAFCPRCRRSTPVSIERLQIFTPGWQEGLTTLEAEAAQIERTTAVPAAAAPEAPAAVVPSKKRHHSRAEKEAPVPVAKKEPPKPVAKKPAAKPAAKKAAPKAKPAAKKPAVKKPAPKSKPKAAAKPKPKKK